MRLTRRDIRLLKDLALSHVLSRDQIIALGYFKSVTRLNTRLRMLKELGFIRALSTPFFNQNLYVVGAKAPAVLGERLGALVLNRAKSPRFLQHALCTTNVRIALLRQGASAWRFEQQLWTSFMHCGTSYTVRPDGLAFMGDTPVLIEVDLGHVTPQKFRQKLDTYDWFLLSDRCQQLWNVKTFSLLTVTTGQRRAQRLKRLMPSDAAFSMIVKNFDELGATLAGGWS